MFSLLGDEGGFITFFLNGLKEEVTSMGLETMLFIFGGAMILYMIANSISLIWSYESRATRAIKKVNKYLKNNPQITDDNLVAFHNMMKTLPYRIRDRWQLFMLEREGSPSRYLSVEYCVKRPLYNSMILGAQKQTAFVGIVLGLLSFLLSLAQQSSTTNSSIAGILLNALIVPAVIAVLACSYVLAMSMKYNSVNHNFYDTFTTFARNVDKATSTMPDYVDYELLFTKKEIEQGIPVLREFLEKKAIEEQRLLEKSKREEMNHSPYNFASLGVNGSQLIERAVTESEEFLTKKLAIQAEIEDYERRLQKTEENMEEIQREANKKLQAIKENLERLDKAMSETTNRVEINYNRRQAEGEAEKRAVLEKDLENMLGKEKVAADAIKVEIQKRKDLIEENKVAVEDALKSEYDTFATRVYDELNEKIVRENAAQMHDLEITIARLKAKIKEFTRDLEKKNSIIEARNLELDNMRQLSLQARGKAKSKDKVAKEYIDAQQNDTDENMHRSMAQATRAGGAFGAIPDDMYTQTSQTVLNAQNYDENLNADAIAPEPVEEVKIIIPDAEPKPEARKAIEGFAPGISKEDLTQVSTLEGPIIDFGITPFAPSLKPDKPAEETPQETEDNGGVENGEDGAELAPTQEQPQTVQVEENQAEEQSQEAPAEEVQPQEEQVQNDELVQENEEMAQELEEAKAETARLKKQVAADARADHERNKKHAKELRRAKEEIERTKKEAREEIERAKRKAEAEAEEKVKSERAHKKSVEDLTALQDKITKENAKLKKQQEELREQIDQTLASMDEVSTMTKEKRAENIKKIRNMITKLKAQAVEAKAKGSSKAEINKINQSVANLLKVLTDYQSAK